MAEWSWKTAYASVIGTSHQKQGTPCQDASGCRVVQGADGERILLMVASDGAGSAIKSEVGSKTTVETFLTHFETLVKSAPLKAINKDHVIDWMRDLNAKIILQANEENLQPKEFACTVLAAIVGAEETVFFQVGDGAIVIADADDYSYVFWPQHGEFANQTNFIIQEDVEQVLEFACIHQPVQKAAIFTDGIERLVLDFASQSVHSPSLAPIFEWLLGSDGAADVPSPAFMAYLGSNHVNARTDDDKTLVMCVKTIL